jgi:cytochrome c oxidase subunit 2
MPFFTPEHNLLPLCKFIYKGLKKCFSGNEAAGNVKVFFGNEAAGNAIVNHGNVTVNNYNIYNNPGATFHASHETAHELQEVLHLQEVVFNIPGSPESFHSAVTDSPRALSPLPIAHCDAAEPWQLGFQDAATPMMQGIIDLHHDIFFFLILILVFVLWILVRTLWHFHYKKNPIPQRIVHGTTIEILWTIFPSIILMFIAIPSFALLYSMDEVVVDPAITIKAIGHQWYRSAPLHEGDLSATKRLQLEYGSRSIWLTGNLPFSPLRDFNNYSMPETGS